MRQAASGNEWVTFRGGADEVIFPGELLEIAKVYQSGSDKRKDGLPLPPKFGPDMRPLKTWLFNAMTLECEVSCEGMTVSAREHSVPDHSEDLPKIHS